MSITTLSCVGCGLTGQVTRVSPGIRCDCGSTHLKIVSSSGGTGWDQPRPDPLKGWDEYAGPMPGPNPRSAPEGPAKCQNCHGTGRSLREVCRACHGSGVRPLTFGEFPEPQVARHNYPSTQTKQPFVGRRVRAFDEDNPPGHLSPAHRVRDENRSREVYSDEAIGAQRSKPFPLHEAPCPSCGHAPTHLVQDYKDDAWWHCPNCGPLANVDRHPEVDPYHPAEGFEPVGPRSFKAGGKAQKTGRILPMLRLVAKTNPGLRTSEALGIVRATVATYPE